MLVRVTAAVTLVATTACVGLQPVWDPARFIAETKPPVVYVMKGREAVLTITNPRVSGDTVLGTLPGESQPVALPLSDVQNIGTVRFNGARTAMLVAGLAALGALATYAVLARAGGDGSEFCDYDRQPMGPGTVECGYPSNP